MGQVGIDDLSRGIGEIANTDRTAYVAALSALPGVTVPPRLGAETLRLLLNYEVQASALGGLTAQEKRALRSIAASKPSNVFAVSTKRPGTHLARDWKGRTYRVNVTEAGYVTDCTTYRLFSDVAKRSPGTT